MQNVCTLVESFASDLAALQHTYYTYKREIQAWRSSNRSMPGASMVTRPIRTLRSFDGITFLDVLMFCQEFTGLHPNTPTYSVHWKYALHWWEESMNCERGLFTYPHVIPNRYVPSVEHKITRYFEEHNNTAPYWISLCRQKHHGDFQMSSFVFHMKSKLRRVNDWIYMIKSV